MKDNKDNKVMMPPLGGDSPKEAFDIEDELEAEQESAAAMGADVPQPPESDETTEGQPS